VPSRDADHFTAPPTSHKLIAHVDDRELLRRIREGDQDAFDTIFRTYYASLVGVVAAMLRQRAVAEELVQDVMLELWRRRETIDVSESLRAYLFQSARNRALNHVRREQVERRGEPHAKGESTSAPAALTQLVAEELDVAIQRSVAALPAPIREVFELSRSSGLKYSEIARELGISVKTVEARMGRALRALREELAPWLPHGGEL
jgi:RNA polymerase sigma-70 factor (ECF subfamily)